MSEYFHLMRAAEKLTATPAFALEFGTTVHMQEFSILGLIFHACETVRDAIVQANRYGQLVIDVDVGNADRFQWLRRDGQLWLVDQCGEPGRRPQGHSMKNPAPDRQTPGSDTAAVEATMWPARATSTRGGSLGSECSSADEPGCVCVWRAPRRLLMIIAGTLFRFPAS